MIVILAGAGASSALNPAEYPTTAKAFQKLPEAVTKQVLFQRAVQYLPEQHQEVVVDIEQVLWLVQELRSVARATSNQQHFAGWILKGGHAQSVLQHHYAGLDQGVQALTRLSSTAESLQKSIEKLIFDWYVRPPTPDELKRTWVPLLAGLYEIQRPIEIFTTNYDIILERAIRAAGIGIDLGRDDQGEYPRLQESRWERDSPPTPSRTGLLTKLHGSIHWKRGAQGTILVGDPTDRSREAANVMIYPGFKGDAFERPFDIFHNYFRNCVRNASVLIVIGFAFRDPQISTIIRDRLAEHAKLILVDPSPPPSERIHVPSNRTEIIEAPFDETSVAEVIKHVRTMVDEHKRNGVTEGLSSSA